MEKIETVQTKVNDNPFLRSLCSLPLHCAMICSYYDENPELASQTVTHLYKVFVETTVNRHFEKGNKGMEEKDQKAQKKEAQYRISQLKLICEVAYENVRNKSKEALHLDDTSGLGLLSVEPRVVLLHSTKKISFIHETIKEYLAALHLKDMSEISDESCSIASEFHKAIENKERNLDEVLKFLCGMVQFKVFKEIVGHNDSIKYQIQCAYEHHSKSAYDYVLERCNYVISFDDTLNSFDCVAISAVIGSSKIRVLR